jgi:hypothetical protein
VSMPCLVLASFFAQHYALTKCMLIHWLQLERPEGKTRQRTCSGPLGPALRSPPPAASWEG